MDAIPSYCQACLSSDRKLRPLEQMESLLVHLALDELYAAQGGICWECQQAIKKFTNFKSKIRTSQGMLQNKIQGLKLDSLSSLYQELNASFEYYFDHDSQKNNVDKKSEPETSDKRDVLEIVVEIKKEVDEHCSDGNNSDDDSRDSFDPKPNIYVDVLKLKDTTKRKKNRTRTEREVEKEELMKTFTKVVFSEGDMLKNREEKRKQPNYKKIPFKCDTCVLGFTRKDTYDIHIEKKHSESAGDFTCPVCEVRFTTEKQVERHKNKHYLMYRCRMCDYETLEQWSAAVHGRSKHGDDHIENIHCGKCDFVGKSPEELALHKKVEHFLKCNECGEKLKSKASMKTHKRRIHKVKREFICDVCSKTFTTKSRLEVHLLSHDPSIEQKLSYCAQCNVQYKNIYVYRSHLRTSAGHAQEGYECQVCNKRFVSKTYLKQHHNFYHLSKSKFYCQPCDKIFMSMWRLRNHRQTQHGESRTKDHACNVCGKAFYTKSTLRDHELTHSSERSYMCEDCGDTFKQRPCLYTHYKLVHKQIKRTKRTVAQ